MRHLTEEEVMLAHYGDALDGELLAHLRECVDCSREADKLRATLAAVDDEVIPEPDSGYEERLWNRLRWQIGAPKRERRLRWLAAAAALALAIGGFVAGRMYRPNGAPSTVATATASGSHPQPSTVATAENPLLDAAARQQIDRSSRLFVEVSNQPAHEGDVRELRTTAEALLADNRLYRANASRDGASQVAELLNEIEPILTELAHSPDQITPEDLAHLQSRIQSRELVFKLRVVASSLQQRQQDNQRDKHPKPLPTSL